MASRPYPPSRPMTGEQAGLPRAGGRVDGRQSASAGRRRAAALPLWPVAAVVILGALLTGLTGVLSLVAPATFLALTGHQGEPLTTGVLVFANYAGAREIAIAAALLVLLALRSQRVLPGLMVVTAGANALDAGDAFVAGRWTQLPGAAVFAIVFLATAVWLFTHARLERLTDSAGEPVLAGGDYERSSDLGQRER